MLGQVFIIYFILTYNLNIVPAFYAGEVSLDDYGNKADKKDIKICKKKINAVLFFADTVADGDYQNSSGLNCLKLEKKPAIKHCTDYPRSILSRRRRHWHFKRHTCTCYHRLQEGIMSLLNYAKNSLGMVTALGSLSNHSFSNSIRLGNSEINVNNLMEANKENEEKSNGENLDDSNNLGGQERNQQENTAARLSDKLEEQYRKIPLLNVFPKDSPPPFYAFTDEEERKKRSEGPYVMEPEHTEIFKIRTKRGMPLNKPKEISDTTYLNQEEKVKTIFDIMDIMNSLQRSLFGTMLQDDS
ncbi:hypothetical protein HHI36_007328, partial [Cryptolaemus montrouzieri]